MENSADPDQLASELQKQLIWIYTAKAGYIRV